MFIIKKSQGKNSPPQGAGGEYGETVQNITEQIILKMIEYDSGAPKRIQNFMKVHDISRTIGKLEKIPLEQIFVLETAAVVHDIGIRCCEKYGSCEGKLLLGQVLNTLTKQGYSAVV